MKKYFTFTPKHMNKFIPVHFQVPPDTKELAIFFSYQPHYPKKDDYTKKIVQKN